MSDTCRKNPVTRGPDVAIAPEKTLSLAYVCPFWPPDSGANGIVMYLEAITKGLRSKGHITTLLSHTVASTLDSSQDIVGLSEFRARRTLTNRILDSLENRFAPTRAYERQVCRSIIAAARRAIAERGVQLLEMEESFGWSLDVSRSLAIPLIVRLHGPWFLNGVVKGVPMDRHFRHRVRKEGEAILKAAAVSASSQDVLDRTRAYYNLRLERAEVIHPPAPEIPVEARWRLEDCVPQSILFVGRFDRHKGGDIAIEAFAHVARRFPEARLKFVGPDSELVDDRGRSWKILEFIGERIPEPHIRNRIEWLGQLPNSVVMNLRRESLISLVSSRYDNFPTTVTEAMALGCPIVASRIGGIPEQITHKVSGLLGRPDDPADLADKLCQILGNPTLAAQLGSRARLDCERLLSLSSISTKMSDFYIRNLTNELH